MDEKERAIERAKGRLCSYEMVVNKIVDAIDNGAHPIPDWVRTLQLQMKESIRVIKNSYNLKGGEDK